MHGCGSYRRARRQAVHWAALLAMLCYVVAPLAPATPAQAAVLTPICTTHGIVLVALPGSDDAPVPAGMPDCPSCALTGHAGASVKAPLPATAALPLPNRSAAPVIFPRAESRRAGIAVAVHRSRGPPLPV